jgi:hypothetical protein
MKANIAPEKALRLTALGLTVLLVLAAAAAGMLYFKLDEVETSASRAKAESDQAIQAAAVERKKQHDLIKGAGAMLADLEQRQNDADKLKTLLSRLEPQIAAALETAAGAKAAKPEARAAALAGLGLVGQIVRGSDNEMALATLDRALLIDKANCVAGLAVNLGGVKKIEVTPDCQALLPGAPAAGEIKPAAETTPAAGTKPEAAPAGGAAKAAAPAAKG